MKTIVKSIVTRAVALAFTLITGTSLAATPVAVWNGDFGTTSKGNYSLDLNGNTLSEDGSCVQITHDNYGLLINWADKTPFSSANGQATVIVKYSNWTPGTSNGALATMWVQKDSNTDVVGQYTEASTGIIGNIWDSAADNRGTKDNKSLESSGTFAIAVDLNNGNKANKGATAYVSSGDSFVRAATGNGDLFATTTDFRSVAIGGMRNHTGLISQKGMKIEAVALFAKCLTKDEVAAFKWPKPIVKTTPKVFALNFDSGTGFMDGTGDSGIPYFDLPGDCWSNFSNASGTRSADGFDLSTPNKDVLDTGLRVTWASGGTYSWADATMPALKGYLDDGEHNGVAGPTITVPNIPFESYDVIILAATDNGSAFRPVTVNGTSYTSGFDGYGVPGTENWGATHCLVPTVGLNMMYIRSQSGALTVQGGNNSNGARGGIAAVIIVEAEVRKASTSGDVDWTAIPWTGSEDPECPYILTLMGDTKITVNEGVEIGNLFVKGTGALTIVDDGNLACSQLDVGDRAFTFKCGEGADVSLNMKGSGAFVKKGAGTLTLSSSFAPASIAVEEGVLKAPLNATDWAFSTAENEKTITVANGAQFDFNGSYGRPISYKIAGEGPEGTGAILKPNGNGNSNQVALGSKLELTADATINTVGRWCMINQNHATNTLDLAGHTLTKIGAGNLVFSNTTVENGGTLVIKQGTVMCNAWLGESGGGRFWEGFDGATIVVDGGTLNVNHGYITDGSPFVLGILDFKSGSVTMGADVGFTVANEIVLPESALATPVVTGNLTLGENAKVRFPAGYVGGAAYCLCSGTLTGREGAVADSEFYIGDTLTVGTLVYANGTVAYDRGTADLAPEGDFTTAWINEQLAGKDVGTTVNLSIKPNATFTIDEAFAFAQLNIACEGNFYLATADGAAPSDAAVAKFFYDGVTGIIIKKWLAMRRVINLNFRDNGGARGFAADDMTFDGLLAGNTPKASWINLGDASSNNGVLITNAWHAGDFEAVEIEGMTVGWKAKTVYQANHDIPVLTGYLDDGDIGSWPDGVTITLTDVPFETYDVIVYYNTDMANRVYPAVKVNGAAYTWDGEQGTTVFGSANWGKTRYDGVAYGDNALRISDLSGDVKITTAPRDDSQSLRGCIPAIQIVEVETKVIVNSYEAEGDADVRVSELNKIVTEGYAGGFTLTLHGGKLIYDAPFVCASLLVNSTGDLSIVKEGEIEETELAKIALNDIAGSVTYGFPTATLATSANGNIYTCDTGATNAPVVIAHTVTDGKMTLKDATFYLGSTASPTRSLIDFVDATVYALDGMGFGIGTADFVLSGSTKVTSAKVVLSEGGAGRTANLTLNDAAKIVVTGNSIVDSNQSSIMFGHWNGPSTFTMNDYAVFDATNAQVLVGKTANNQTINLNGGTFIAKGIKVSGGASGVNTLNWVGGELQLGKYGITSYNANRITVNVTNEVTLTATDATLPLSQPIAGPGTIRKQGEGVLELTSSLANFTGKIVAEPEDVISLTNNVLPLAGGMLAKIEGTVMISAIKGDSWFKICEGVETVPENLTILDMDGQEITPLCVVDGDLYYGEVEGTFELQPADLAAIKALTAGGVYLLERPTLAVSETCTNLPEGFGWKREGDMLYFFKKSNSISLKLGTRTSNKDSAILKTDTDVGGFPVAGVVWNNGRIWNQNNTAYTDYVKLMDGNGEMTAATIAYRAPNTYFNKDCPLDSGNQRLTSTYLDDGADAGSTTYTVNYSSQGLEIPEGGIVLPAAPNARGWEMKLSDIPYEMYDLYVYIASDQAQDGFKGCPVVVSIDGKNWTYYAGAKIGTDSSVWTPDVYSKDGTVTEGKNYIRFRISKASMQAEDISTIYLTHGTRNTGAKKRIGLAGIQIVEIDDDGVRNYVGTGNWVADGAWQTSKGEQVEWKDAEDGDVVTAIINASDHNSISVNSNVVATTVKLVGGSADSVFTVYGSADSSLTAKAVDATLFSGTLNLYAPIFGPIALGANCAVVLDPDSSLGAYEFSAGRVIIPVHDTRTVTIPANLASDGVEVVAKAGATVQLAFGEGVTPTGYTYPTKVVIEEGGVFDLAGFIDHSFPIVLAGGTLINSGVEMGENTRQYWQMSVISNSTIDVSGNMFGSVNNGKNAHNYLLNGCTVTKTGSGEYYIANATFDTGKFVVNEGLLVLDQFTISSNEVLTVEVAEGATLKLMGTQHGADFGTLNIVNKGGTVNLQASVTVGDFIGTGTLVNNGSLTVKGTADYPAIPGDTAFVDGATVRLATGRNVLKDDLLSFSGSVTLDAAEGATIKGKGFFAIGLGTVTPTEAFRTAMKNSERLVEFGEDSEIGFSFVEIKAIPKFLLMLK